MSERDHEPHSASSEPKPESRDSRRARRHSRRHRRRRFCSWSLQVGNPFRALMRLFRPRRQRVQYRLLAVVTVVVVGTAGSVHLLHEHQVRRLAGHLLEHADRAEAEDKPAEAIRHLRAYVTHTPHDVEARARLAVLFDDRAAEPREVFQAMRELDNVVLLHPDRTDLRRRLVTRLMQFGRWKDALEHLRVLKASHPGDGDLAFLMGECYERENKPALAVAAYREAIDRDADNWEAYLRSFQLLRGFLNQPQQANELAQEMVKRNSTSPQAFVHRARYRFQYRFEEDAPDSEKDPLKVVHDDLDQADKLDPNFLKSKLLRADVVLADPQSTAEDFEQVRERLQRELAHHPHEPRLYLSLTAIALRTDAVDRAVEVLERGRQALPEDLDISWRLAELWIIRGESQRAEREIERLRQLDAPQPIIDYLAGRRLIAGNHPAEARQLLTNVLRDPAVSLRLRIAAGLQLAECCGRLGLFEEQLHAYESVREVDANSLPAQLGRAAALSALGRFEMAMEAYQPLLSLPEVRLRYARVWLEGTRRLPPAARDWKRILEFLAETQTNATTALEQGLLRAAVLHAQGQVDQANDVIEQLASDDPREIAVRLAQARLALVSGDWQRAAQILETSVQPYGDSVALRLVWAEYWTKRGGEEALPALERLAADHAHFPKQQQVALWLGLASAFRALGDLPKTLELLQKVGALQPESVPIQFDVATLAAQLDRPEVYKRAVTSLSELVGDDSPHVRIVEIYWLLERGEMSERDRRQARAALTQIASQRTTWAVPFLLLARLNQSEGDFAAAAENYDKAVELGTRDVRVLREAVELLAFQGKLDEAQRLIRQFQDDVPDPLRPEVQQLASVAAFHQGDIPQALVEAQVALGADPGNWRNHLWAGALQAAVGQPDAARSSFEQAVKLAPGEPTPWVALVSFLARNNQQPLAAQVVEQAAQSLTAPEHAVPLGMCYELIGETKRAEERFQAVLSDRPDDPQVVAEAAAFYLRTSQDAKAEPLLNRLLGGLASTPPRIQWARRALAAIYSQRDYHQFLEALKLLETNLAEAADRTADQRLKAQWLAARPIVKHRREAARLLESLAGSGRLAAADRQLLANLYDALNEREKADDTWDLLVREHPDAPTVLAGHAGRLLARNDANAADESLGRLEQVAPDQSATVELAAWSDVLKGGSQAAVERLTRWIEGADQPATRRERQSQAARTLAQLWSTANVSSQQQDVLADAAEGWYRGLLDNDPHIALPLARFLATSGRVDEALDLCDKARRSLPASQVTTFATSIVLAAQATPEQLRRVKDWYLDGSLQGQDRERSIVEVLHLADLLMSLEEFDKAESVYRSVLDRQGDQIIALNNLAWLVSCVRGQHEDAKKFIGRAIDVAGPVGELLDTRAVVWMNAGDTDRAIRDLNEALEVSSSPHQQLHLAQAHWRAGNRFLASSSLRKAEHSGLKQTRLNRFDQEIYDNLRAKLLEPKTEPDANQRNL